MITETLPTIDVTAHVGAAQSTQIDQSQNKALPWIAFSWFLSGGAVIGLILMALLQPALMDAKIEKAAAQNRELMAKELAKAQADMHMASTNALLAKDRTDKVAASLEARGLIKLENH